MTYTEQLLYRLKQGFKYKLGFLPTRKKIDEYIKNNGKLISKATFDSGVYRTSNRIYSFYQRGEIGTRYVYELDGQEYVFLEIRKK